MAKAPLTVDTAFASYQLSAPLGEGGAGIVYAGTGPEGERVAVKILRENTVTSVKQKRFKNEIGFLLRTNHTNVVPIIGHGYSADERLKGPFYVMPRYDGSLRALMGRGLAHESIMGLFSQILAGVEAAHISNVVHRDLKPENILCDGQGTRLAIADFGIASFTDDLMLTVVETKPRERLANFGYAAPEQFQAGQSVDARADIFALGRLLNEMFTGHRPMAVDYPTIGSVAPAFEFLDDLVAAMLRQAPEGRPASIAHLKGEIERRSGIAQTRQRLSALTGAVVPDDEIDDPLALEPPELANFDYTPDGTLVLILDRRVSPGWIDAIKNRLGNYNSVAGAAPSSFHFEGDRASIRSDPDPRVVQSIVDHFKQWLPQATGAYRQSLRSEQKRRRAAELARIERDKKTEEARLRILRSTKI
jgi:serine/threonine protein kinase